MDAGRWQAWARSAGRACSTPVSTDQCQVMSSISSHKTMQGLALQGPGVYHVGRSRGHKRTMTIVSATAPDDVTTVAMVAAAASVLPMCWFYLSRARSSTSSSSSSSSSSQFFSRSNSNNKQALSNSVAVAASVLQTSSPSKSSAAEQGAVGAVNGTKLANGVSKSSAVGKPQPQAFARTAGAIVEETWTIVSSDEAGGTAEAAVGDEETSGNGRGAVCVATSSFAHTLLSPPEGPIYPELSGLITDMVLQAWTSTDGDEVEIKSEQTESRRKSPSGESIEVEDLVARDIPSTTSRPGEDLEAKWMETIVLGTSGSPSSYISGVNGTPLQGSGYRENGAVNGSLKSGSSSQEAVKDRVGSGEDHNLTVENTPQPSHLTNGALRAYIEASECVDGVPEGSVNEDEMSKPQPEIPPNDNIDGVINGRAKLQASGVLKHPELGRADRDTSRPIAEENFSTREVVGPLEVGTVTVQKNVATRQTSSDELTSTVNRINGRPKTVTNAARHVKKGVRRVPTTISEVLPLKSEETPEHYSGAYDKMLRAGRIQDCLILLEELEKAGKLSSMKLNHFRFYEACKKRRAVKEAFTFVRLMLSDSTIRHFTMLLSVCCHSKDIDGALRVLALLESRGLKADCMFYTTLISACAKAGKVDLLFQIFHEMETAGIEANVHTFGAMIDGCARAGQLPKAFGAYGIMIANNVKPDRVIFNTLINACGRAGAVQRAYDVLSDMKAEATPVKPDHVTYGALISACARGGEVERAFEAYKSMRASGIKGSPECYTAAVHACSQRGDMDYALTVYADLKRDGVRPDEVFFSALIDVAGHSAQIEKAFSILQEMKKAGMKPGAVVYSSIMGVCSNLGKWERALDVYKEIRSAGLRPTVSTFNALMTALCDAKQLSNALTVLKDLRKTGMMPNQISYSILLKACKKENEADMAIDLYTNARAEGIKPDLIMCDSIIGLCLQRIQTSASAPQIPCSILPVPADNSHIAPQEQWATWALAIYRRTLEAGVLPTVETLSQLLGCLRKSEETKMVTSSFDDRSLAFLGQPQPVTPTPVTDGFGVYDPRALALFEEASSLNVVPSFSYTGVKPITISAETMPVFAAEVCVLTVLKGLKHRHAAGARVPAVTIKFLVEKKEHYSARVGQVSMTTAGRTGQAVAALLRRLQLKFQGYESSGEIRLTVIGIRNWLSLKPSATPALKTAFTLPEGANSPYSLLARSIANQQRSIRMGDIPPQYRDLDLGHGQYHEEESNEYSPTRRRKGASKSSGRASSFQRSSY